MFQSHRMLVGSESRGLGRAPGRGRGAQSVILSALVSQAQGLGVWATCRADPGLSQGHVVGGRPQPSCNHMQGEPQAESGSRAGWTLGSLERSSGLWVPSRLQARFVGTSCHRPASPFSVPQQQ